MKIVQPEIVWNWIDFRLKFFKLSDATIKNVFMMKKKILDPGEAELEVHRFGQIKKQNLSLKPI